MRTLVLAVASLSGLYVSAQPVFKSPPAGSSPPKSSQRLDEVAVQGAIEAHLHGLASLDWALENEKTSIIEFRVDGDSIFGFEHAPKTEQETSAHQEGLEKLRIGLPAALALDPSLGCSWRTEKGLFVDYAKNHSKVTMKLTATCKKSLRGTKFQPQISKHFPKIETVVVRVVGASKAGLFTIVNDKGEIDFSKAF
jgi:hypothetical protein